MANLNFPTYNIKQKTENNKNYVWDIVRKKWIVNLPEEWVRQNLIWFLINQLGFSKNSMSVEKQIKLNEMKKRYDLVVHNKDLKPLVLVECKAPKIKITQAVFNQAAHYNLVLKVPFLLLTNGINHFFCEISFEDQSFKFHKEILTWKQILKLTENE